MVMLGGLRTRCRIGTLLVLALALAIGSARFAGSASAGGVSEDAAASGSTPLSSGWAQSHLNEAGVGHSHQPDDFETSDEFEAAVLEAFPQSRSWCLGDDLEGDPVGDPGPDLIAVQSQGACDRAGADVRLSVTTMTPPEAAEFLVDVDRDPSTGCNGFDRAYVLFTVGQSSAIDVATPTCDSDTWVDLPGGPGIGTNSGGVPPVTILILPQDQILEMVWTAGVGNADGSGYDAAWTRFFVSTETIECGTNRVTEPDGDAGYLLMGMDGSVWTFGNALVGPHSCRSGLGLARVVDFEHLPVEGFHSDSWMALHADGWISHRGDFLWARGPVPWQVGATEAVAVLPLLDEGLWSGNAFIVYDNGAVEGVSVNGAPRSTYGDVRSLRLSGPIIDAVLAPDGQGYWLVGMDGGVFSLGSARFFGSMGAVSLNEPVVAMVADPDGSGYWLVAADGGVFAFEAPYVGSVPGALPPGVGLNRPIVGMTPYGSGYLMFASDGGVFNFSDLGFAGSLGHNPPRAPIVGVVAPPT